MPGQCDLSAPNAEHAVILRPEPMAGTAFIG